WCRTGGEHRQRRTPPTADRLGEELRRRSVFWCGPHPGLVFGSVMLSFIVFLPLVGALLVLAAGGRGDRPDREPLARGLALAVSILTFVATLVLWWRFDPSSAAYQFEERYAWIPAFGIQYYIGVDGISLLLIVLTGFLTPLALLSSWHSVHKNVKNFSFFILALD